MNHNHTSCDCTSENKMDQHDCHECNPPGIKQDHNHSSSCGECCGPLEKKSHKHASCDCCGPSETKKNKLLLPNSGNGSKTDVYVWTQTEEEIEIYIPVPEGSSKQDLKVNINPNNLKVAVKGKFIVDDEWDHFVKADESYWTLQDKKTLLLCINKRNQNEMWSKLLKKELEINTNQSRSENSKNPNSEDNTQQLLEKLRKDQLKMTQSNMVTEAV